MSIVEAKKELYRLLREKDSDGVTGAGIRGKSGAETIVIFLTKPKTKLAVKVPATYKGNKVTTEQRSAARAV